MENTSKMYQGTIQELFSNAVSTVFVDSLEVKTEHTVTDKVKEQRTELLSLIPQDKRLDAEDLVDGITYEYENAFYVVGFRRAVKLMFDCLAGDGSN